VDFRNTTFILTSNVGSSVITRDASLGFATARPTRPPTSTVT
jgi:ATP-dependent Clp protease ATP-binding subunit ClpA